jgi:hypothetical protein
MERLEDELKDLMELKSGSIRAFAIDNDIPYTTLTSMLQRGVMSTGVINTIKICQALNIKPESLPTGTLEFYDGRTTTFLSGENNGEMAGNNHGSVTINNGAPTQETHNESMHGMSKADLKLQRVIANKIEKQIQVEQNMSDKMDKIADKLDTLIDLLKK